MSKKQRLIIYLKLFLTAVFWGGTFIAGRVVVREVGPYSTAFFRFVIACLFLLTMTRRENHGLPGIKKGQIIPILLLGATGVFAYNVFFLKGLKLITAGRAALIIANNPVVIALFASWFFKEKLSLVKLAGIIISIMGAMIVISRGQLGDIFNGALGPGDFYIFLCVLCWSAYSLIGKAAMADLSPLVVATYSCLAGTLFLIVPGLYEGMATDFTHYSISAWFSIFYLGFFGTVLGFVWYYEGIKVIGATKASQFINFVPISAVLLAFFMLGEPITLSLAVGTLVVCFGVYLTNRTPHPARATRTRGLVISG
ncbi:MAG: DMT family transporter [Desulfatiglandaceae bacterium]|jgi:drug/metabolite transporter (DMT)-like permease